MSWVEPDPRPITSEGNNDISKKREGWKPWILVQNNEYFKLQRSLPLPPSIPPLFITQPQASEDNQGWGSSQNSSLQFYTNTPRPALPNSRQNSMISKTNDPFEEPQQNDSYRIALRLSHFKKLFPKKPTLKWEVVVAEGTSETDMNPLMTWLTSTLVPQVKQLRDKLQASHETKDATQNNLFTFISSEITARTCSDEKPKPLKKASNLHHRAVSSDEIHSSTKEPVSSDTGSVSKQTFFSTSLGSKKKVRQVKKGSSLIPSGSESPRGSGSMINAPSSSSSSVPSASQSVSTSASTSTSTSATASPIIPTLNTQNNVSTPKPSTSSGIIGSSYLKGRLWSVFSAQKASPSTEEANFNETTTYPSTPTPEGVPNLTTSNSSNSISSNNNAPEGGVKATLRRLRSLNNSREHSPDPSKNSPEPNKVPSPSPLNPKPDTNSKQENTSTTHSSSNIVYLATNLVGMAKSKRLSKEAKDLVKEEQKEEQKQTEKEAQEGRRNSKEKQEKHDKQQKKKSKKGKKNKKSSDEDEEGEFKKEEWEDKLGEIIGNHEPTDKKSKRRSVGTWGKKSSKPTLGSSDGGSKKSVMEQFNDLNNGIASGEGSNNEKTLTRASSVMGLIRHGHENDEDDEKPTKKHSKKQHHHKESGDNKENKNSLSIITRNPDKKQQTKSQQQQQEEEEDSFRRERSPAVRKFSIIEDSIPHHANTNITSPTIYRKISRGSSVGDEEDGSSKSILFHTVSDPEQYLKFHELVERFSRDWETERVLLIGKYDCSIVFGLIATQATMFITPNCLYFSGGISTKLCLAWYQIRSVRGVRENNHRNTPRNISNKIKDIELDVVGQGKLLLTEFDHYEDVDKTRRSVVEEVACVLEHLWEIVLDRIVRINIMGEKDRPIPGLRKNEEGPLYCWETGREWSTTAIDDYYEQNNVDLVEENEEERQEREKRRRRKREERKRKKEQRIRDEALFEEETSEESDDEEYQTESEVDSDGIEDSWPNDDDPYTSSGSGSSRSSSSSSSSASTTGSRTRGRRSSTTGSNSSATTEDETNNPVDYIPPTPSIPPPPATEPPPVYPESVCPIISEVYSPPEFPITIDSFIA